MTDKARRLALPTMSRAVGTCVLERQRSVLLDGNWTNHLLGWVHSDEEMLLMTGVVQGVTNSV
jgi:hypothetical protein